MSSERSNKGKEKLIEDGDHNPSQNNLPGSQNFGGGGDLNGRRATDAAVAAAVAASCSHSAPKKRGLNCFDLVTSLIKSILIAFNGQRNSTTILYALGRSLFDVVKVNLYHLYLNQIKCASLRFASCLLVK